MKEFTSNCIILKKGYFKEYDIWIRVISPIHGLLTLFAFGGAKSKRRFCGCLDLLNTLSCKISFANNKNYYVLEEAKLIENAGSLRKNWRAMGMAHNCTSFLNSLEIDPESAAKTYELIENMRATLALPDPVSPLFPLYYRFRLACILGYEPELSVCEKCGRIPANGNVYFAFDEGKIYCSKCQKYLTFSKKIRLPLEGLMILKRVKNSLPSNWPNIKMAAELRCAIAQALDNFVQFHLGLEYCNGFFRHL